MAEKTKPPKGTRPGRIDTSSHWPQWLSVQKVEVGNIWFTFFAIPSDSLVCARGRSTIGCSSLQRCTVLLKRRGVNSESSCAGERGQSLESDPKNSNSTFNHGKRFSITTTTGVSNTALTTRGEATQPSEETVCIVLTTNHCTCNQPPD